MSGSLASVPAVMNDDDLKDLRLAFGQFATGITIVTTAGPDREPIGVTANSFNSVSLHPPMVLWSLADKAKSRFAFEQSEFFCIHVLAATQREISERFACGGEDKFGSVDWSWGDRCLPMLEEYSARFQCRNASQYPVGDHVVFVGEVITYENTDKRPLVFHGGQYALAERRMMEQVAREVGDQLPHSGDRRKRR